MTFKRISLALFALFALFLLGCGGMGASIFVSFPAQQGPRVQGQGFIGVETEGSYAWVIDTDSGVVLVDAGMDPAAKALHEVIAGRPVRAVLITHGHLDHVAGLQGLEQEATYCGPGEAPVARGEVPAKSWMARLFGLVMGYPQPRPELREVRDGQALLVDGARFTAIHLPGHTGGSTAWVYGETVFTGDSALGHGDHIAPVHWVFSDDGARATASLSKLEGLAVTHLADGHAGLHAMP